MLHVVESQGAGAFVVLVHGAMDRSSSFGKVMRALPDLHVVAYDRRGYARSRAIGAAGRFDDHVEDLLDVMAGRRGVAVGHSFGADVALAAAIRAPDVVAAVGAWEPPIAWLPWWPTATAGAAALGAGTPEEAAEAFFRKVAGDRTWDRLPDRTKGERRADGPAVLSDVRAITTAPPLDLGAVPVPVVVAHGRSSLPHHVRGARHAADAIPDAEVLVLDGSHGAHTSHPAQFAVLVRATVERAGPA